jgi:Asp-tRNA(Asn)/Glu-tRNA(Gln) amidotransferase A subunit family amidase
MQAMAERLAAVDLYVGSGQDLPITNLTGHPSAVFPMGFRDRDGRKMPGSVTLTGRLYDETTLLAVAHIFQQATGDHLRRPPLDTYLAEEASAKAQVKS